MKTWVGTIRYMPSNTYFELKKKKKSLNYRILKIIKKLGIIGK